MIKCDKCGYENQNINKFCIVCGNQLNQNMNNVTNPVIKKKNNFKLICIIIFALVLIGVSVSILSSKTKKLDIFENININVSGFNGSGYIEIIGLDENLATGDLLEYVEILAEQKEKYSKKINSFSDVVESTNAMSLISYAELESFAQDIYENNGNFSNGDTVTLGCNTEQCYQALKELNVEIIDKTFTITGLPESKNFDPFSDIKYIWKQSEGIRSFNEDYYGEVDKLSMNIPVEIVEYLDYYLIFENYPYDYKVVLSYNQDEIEKAGYTLNSEEGYCDNENCEINVHLEDRPIGFNEIMKKEEYANDPAFIEIENLSIARIGELLDDIGWVITDNDVTYNIIAIELISYNRGEENDYVLHTSQGIDLNLSYSFRVKRNEYGEYLTDYVEKEYITGKLNMIDKVATAYKW